MTTKDVQATLADITAHRNKDPEYAHEARDGLYLSVLQTIAAGSLSARQAQYLAADAVKAQDIKFKWYACA